MIAEHFVPVALNANRIPDDSGGAFFKKVMETNRWPQGLWIVSPEGKVLAFHYFQVKSGEATAASKFRWIAETREVIQSAVKASGVVPRDTRRLAGWNPLPERGVGRRENGGVRLAVSATAFLKGKREGDPAVDSILLNAKEWAALRPAKLEAGAKWTVPKETAARLVPALSPHTDLIYVPQAKDATKAELSATVDSVDRGVAKVRYSGNFETLHLRDGQEKFPVRTAASAQGVATIDAEKNELRSLLLVFDGQYRHVPPWDKPQSTGAVVEWKAK